MRKTNITWKVNPSTVFAVVPEDYLEQSSWPESLPSIVETESKVASDHAALSTSLKQNQPTDDKLNEQALQVQRNNIASIKSLLVTEQNNCTRNQAQLNDDIAACQDHINELNHDIYDLETKLNSLQSPVAVPGQGQGLAHGPGPATAPAPSAVPVGVATQGVTSVPGVPGTAQVIGALPETNSSKIALDGRQTQSSEVAPLSVQSLGGNQVNHQQKAVAALAPNMATRGQNAPNTASYIYDRQAQAQARAQANAARTMSDNAQGQWSTSSFDQAQGQVLPQRQSKNQGYGQRQRHGQVQGQGQSQGFSQGQVQGRGQGRGYRQGTVPMSAKPQNDPRYGQMGVPEANGTQYGAMGPQGGNMPPYAVPNRAQYGTQGSMGAPINMPMANGPQYGAMGPQGGNWPHYGAPQGPQAQYGAMGPQSGNWPYYGTPQGPQAQYGAMGPQGSNGPQYGAPQGPQAHYGAIGPQGANGPQYGAPQGPQAQYGSMGPQGANGSQYGAPQGPQYGVPYGAFDPAANAAQRAWAQQMAMEQQMALEQQMAMEQQQRAMIAMGQQFNYMNMPVAPRPNMGAFYGNYVAPSTQDQYWEQQLPNGLTYRPDADLYIMIDQRFDYLHNLMKTLAVRGIRIMLFNNMCLYDRNDIILLPYRFDPLPSDHVFVYGADKQSLWKWLKAEFSFRNINLSAKG